MPRKIKLVISGKGAETDAPAVDREGHGPTTGGPALVLDAHGVLARRDPPLGDDPEELPEEVERQDGQE